MFFALFMLYAVRAIGVSAALLGVLTMIGGAAALLGATTSNRIARTFGVGRTLVLVYAAPGLAGLLVPLAGHFDSHVTIFVLIAGMQVVWALSVAINLVISESVKQMLVADGMLGRVTATVRFVTWGVDPLGAPPVVCSPRAASALVAR